MRQRMNKFEHQLRTYINTKSKIGESRHGWKQEERNEEYKIESTSGSEYFFSKSDMKNTFQKTMVYLKWVQETNPNWKKDYPTIFDIPREIQLKYLSERLEDHSKNTVKADISAINKIFNDKFEDPYNNSRKRIIYSDIGLTTSYTEITKNRTEPILSDEQKLKNYGQILMGQSFGLRRSEIFGADYPLRPESFYIHNDKLYADTIGKGGKFRTVECLEGKKEEVIQYLSQFGEIREQAQKTQSKNTFKNNYKEYSEPIFQDYDTSINNHYYRREYAQDKYDEIKDNLGHEDKTYRGCDPAILREVTQNLGHNRLDVVVYHYLR